MEYSLTHHIENPEKVWHFSLGSAKKDSLHSKKSFAPVFIFFSAVLVSFFFKINLTPRSIHCHLIFLLLYLNFIVLICASLLSSDRQRMLIVNKGDFGNRNRPTRHWKIDAINFNAYWLRQWNSIFHQPKPRAHACVYTNRSNSSRQTDCLGVRVIANSKFMDSNAEKRCFFHSVWKFLPASSAFWIMRHRIVYTEEKSKKKTEYENRNHEIDVPKYFD